MIEDLNNKKFDLFGDKWQIKIKDTVIDARDRDLENLFGQTIHGAVNIIEVAKIIDGKDVPEEQQYLALLHELMHAICDSGLYLNITKDEPFIEWAAKCLYALKKQKII